MRVLIKDYRLKRGLTLEKLAQRTGLPAATLNRLERGLQPVTLPDLARIAAVLQVRAKALFEDDDPRDEEALAALAPRCKRARPGRSARTLYRAAASEASALEA